MRKLIKFWRCVRMILAYRLMPKTNRSVRGNSHMFSGRLERYSIKFVITDHKDLTSPYIPSREDMVLRLAYIRHHEKQMDWKVPEPSVEVIHFASLHDRSPW